MLLKYFYDEKLAQASYMVGCAATGDAMIIDPARDIALYLEAAQAHDLRIAHVTETHIHADFVSGSRELARRTGAKLYLSGAGGADWQYDFGDDAVIPAQDGDSWMVGNIKVEVLHTPGHTPEHISFMITDTAGADRPIGIFTGDFLFVGDVGRPDLLEEAAGVKGTKEVGARQQFHSAQRFKELPDYLQIWPGHGAGSACGKALGAIPSTTLGYEKLFNPAFQFADEGAFVEWLLSGQPEPPRYFAQMKKVNKIGPALLGELEQPRHLGRSELDAAIASEAVVVDMRNPDVFARGHLPGTFNIPANRANFINYVGWFVDYERPFYFIAPSEEKAEWILSALRGIGVDHVPGYFTPEVVAGETQVLPLMTAQDLAAQMTKNGLVIVDVRGASEYAEEHIAGSKHIPLGYIPDRLGEIPRDRTVVTQCATGYRSQIAASLLQRYGFENVYNLAEGQAVWSKVLPTG